MELGRCPSVEDGRLNRGTDSSNVASGHVCRAGRSHQKPVIQLILIAAPQQKTQVLRLEEAANSAAIYQFRNRLEITEILADIAES
jgi:hypothetical protein